MQLKQCYAIAALLWLQLLQHAANALPATYGTDADFILPLDSADRFDRDYYYSLPLSNYRLSNLRRGYYYIDDGFITSVPPYGYEQDSVRASAAASRRQDTQGDGVAVQRSGNRYAPVLKYKQTKTKHKKLFVPNFFG